MNKTLTNILPTSFPVQNTYRHVVFNAEVEPDEFPRLEMMIADAIKNARVALKIGKGINLSQGRSFLLAIDNLANHVSRGRVLAHDFREDASEILIHLDQAEPGNSDDMIDMHTKLTLALTLSQRVADLLAAERDIGWHRGIRND